MTPIRELDRIDPQTFRAEIVPGYEPVVLRGLVRDWPLVRAGSDEAAVQYLLGFDKGGVAEAFVGSTAINGRFFYAEDMRGFNFDRRRGRLGDLLQHLLVLRERADAPAIYAGAVETRLGLPGFEAANAMPLLDGLDAAPRIWIGNASTVSTHFDASDNVACVASGRRRFTLFPPSQIHNLYIGPLDHTMAGQPTSMVELNDPDFDRFPRFREALDHARSAELGPGDAIYIPSLWWHQVDALSPFNLLVNYWWSDSPDQAARFEAMVYAMMAIGHQDSARREAWSAMFDTFVFRRHGDPAAHMPPEHRGILAEPTPKLRQYIKGFLARGLQRP